MNFRNRIHIISPAAAFTLHFKGANVLGILGRAHLIFVFPLSPFWLPTIASRR